MDTAVKQQADSNGQTIVTATERQALIQRLYDNFRYFIIMEFSIFRAMRWPLELSKQIENQAFEKTHGIKVD